MNRAKERGQVSVYGIVWHCVLVGDLSVILNNFFGLIQSLLLSL